MKPWHFFTFLVLTSLSYQAQNCSCLSTSKNKKEGVLFTSGTATTLHHYSLMIDKKTYYKDTSMKPSFSLLLHAASRVLLSDSVLKTKGIMEIELADHTQIKYDSVSYYNNPLGFGPALGFVVKLNEEEFRRLSASPIAKLSVLNGDLKTSFNEKQQEKAKQIIDCLLKEK